MIHLRLIPLLLLLLWPTASLAQSDRWPDHADLYVNDIAGIIDAPAEDRLRAILRALRSDTGVEMTVLTIGARRDYVEGETLAGFAKTLFNIWGVGDAERNDGILVLVAHDDRAMRIALGSGYSSDWNTVAQAVIDDSFLPRFREDRYSAGILEGTEATIARIARPHAAGAEPPQGTSFSLRDLAVLAGFSILAVFLVLKRKLGDVGYRMRRCPNCGQRGLHRDRRVLSKATPNTPGLRETEITCRNCDYRDRRTEDIPPRSAKGDPGDFGGGTSSGGGASGRW
ncbi:Beta-propeller domains of methanol dehydrogenase type [Rhodovulum sp. P5]|uniref:TPM domain-containing protein n=1 Tax=Rhodovulum sp. P5 TaxID=1564506 RepID=UPI0009C24DB3|nr:TPM domain-containing protein [Rhodovulum sp. P5]ARE38880.1 Beta-propeller domains of methanol dehydrogenase type [Rhodovulum sp. P5]